MKMRFKGSLAVVDIRFTQISPRDVWEKASFHCPPPFYTAVDISTTKRVVGL